MSFTGLEVQRSGSGELVSSGGVDLACRCSCCRWRLPCRCEGSYQDLTTSAGPVSWHEGLLDSGGLRFLCCRGRSGALLCWSERPIRSLGSPRHASPVWQEPGLQASVVLPPARHHGGECACLNALGEQFSLRNPEVLSQASPAIARTKVKIARRRFSAAKERPAPVCWTAVQLSTIWQKPDP